MTPFRDTIPGLGGYAVIVSAVLLFFIQLVLAVTAYTVRRNALYAVLCTLRALIGAFYLIFLLDGIYTLEYLPYEREYTALTRALYDAPWLFPVIVECVSLGLSALCAVYALRMRRARPTLWSIKKALDFLPVGVCIGGGDGSVLLSNLKMNGIYSSLSGKALTDTGELPKVFSADEASGGAALCKTGEHVFLFSQSSFEINGTVYGETTVEDQTERYGIIKELEEKNTRLRDLRYRLKAYRVRDEDLMIKRELLEARKTVHNELGGALLTGKYRFEHPENVDEKKLLELLRHINTYLLSEAEEPEDIRDKYISALETARRIGVRIAVAGDPPRDEPYRSICGLALLECAANTVKHAGGDEVCVAFSEENGMRRAVITNNGMPPAKPVTETGGLLTLRMEAEAAGVCMRVQSLPEFCLSLSYPTEKNSV